MVLLNGSMESPGRLNILFCGKGAILMTSGSVLMSLSLDAALGTDRGVSTCAFGLRTVLVISLDEDLPRLGDLCEIDFGVEYSSKSRLVAVDEAVEPGLELSDLAKGLYQFFLETEFFLNRCC